MQTNKSIAVVGSGWRAFTWFNIINVMSGVTLKTVVCRNAEKAEQIRKMYPHARVVAEIMPDKYSNEQKGRKTRDRKAEKTKRKIGGIFSSTAQRNIYKMLQKSFAATNSRV